ITNSLAYAALVYLHHQRITSPRFWVYRYFVTLASGCVCDLSEIFKMNEPAEPITVALRIPGTWSHPRELIERLPDGCRLTGDVLVLPDGTQVGFGAARADDQFAGIFRSSCRQPPTEDELATVDHYTVNVYLIGPGGSL